MHNLLLFERLAISTTNFRQNITRLAPNWHRSIKAVGGDWMGDFSIDSTQLARGQIIDLYNQAIGWRVEERSYGFTTWEGRIAQLKLTLDGAEYTRSLDPENWHNRVAVRYPPTITDWAETTASSDLYGESEYIDSVGGAYTVTAANARRDRRLAEHAFPRSRATGGLYRTDQITTRGVRLDVLCAGYVFSVNQRHRLTDTATAAISTQLGVLIAESEFVTAGSIATNAMSVPISVEEVPKRLWDLMEELIGMGDTSGNEYVGGVYPGRLFNYAAAATTVAYSWRNGTLYNGAGQPELATHIKPNTIVELAGVPRSQAVPGGGTKEKPSRVYIEQVEFIAPNGYRLIPRYGPVLEGTSE